MANMLIKENDETDLPSFPHIKNKTNRDLYSESTSPSYDRSAKGSVDIPIRPLVDLLNSHSCYATLSSCSGRIALFDPNAFHVGISEENKEVSETRTESTNGRFEDSDLNDRGNGKGKLGSWLLASHAKITLEQLENALLKANQSNNDSTYSHPVIFKHEPLLLHVAASNLQKARSLLQIALTNCGLRESGMIHTGKRITVAIRSHALALSVPLGRPGSPLYPGRQYLEALVEEANQRFELNEQKIQLLEREVKRILFIDHTKELKNVIGLQNAKKSNNLKAMFQPFPQLNLWGHCTESIILSKTFSTDHAPDVDLITIGGFGSGPETRLKDEKKIKKDATPRTLSGHVCTRSNKIYVLKRRKGKWDPQWHEKGCDQSEIFSPREGHASCTLSSPNFSFSNSPIQIQQFHVIAIFGGRASPVKPSNELYFYCYSTALNQKDYFIKPIVNGQSPSARWGHTFTALGAEAVKNGNLAVIIGGRNENMAFSSIHILSLESKSDCFRNSQIDGMTPREWLSSLQFKWQKIEFKTPLYHHSAVLVPNVGGPSDKSDTIFIFGGLSNPKNLLEALGNTNGEDTSSKNDRKEQFQTKIRLSFIDINDPPSVKIEASDLELRKENSFASTIHYVSTFKDESNPYHYLITCGGITESSDDSNSINSSKESSPHQFFQVARYENCESRPVSFETDFRSIAGVEEEGMNSSLMVHHTSVIIPNKQLTNAIPKENVEDVLGGYEIFVLGGGVSTFAFGPAFSRCYRISFSSNATSHTQNVRNIKVAEKALRGNGMEEKLRPLKSKKIELPVTKVFYVENKKAKLLKNALEAESFLDRSYRITKADKNASIEDPSKYVAVPVINSIWEKVNSNSIDSDKHAWISLVQVIGEQEVMYSSTMLGKMKASYSHQ